jgi:hypothetical protein
MQNKAVSNLQAVYKSNPEEIPAIGSDCGVQDVYLKQGLNVTKLKVG